MARPDLTLPEWSDEDLEKLAEMTPERQSEAEGWWRERAPRRISRLLEAKAEEGNWTDGGDLADDRQEVRYG